MIKHHFHALLICFFLTASINVYSQKKPAAKYPSLFWEITGNGLKKPSYLFGTMHVSSKMVFHLSDSFYTAMKSVDAVALELNPELWQPEMVDLDRMKQNYVAFTREPGGDYLTENSFSIQPYEDELKAALSTEPTVVNSLLYRTYQTKEDFEENTFLDLYIFQTGRRLGKRAAGVENYYETEKIVMEAYADMANEKKKKSFDADGESMSDIQEKMENAYRRGDLDLMDSLDILTEGSVAFQEKFLYKRNEIQANSIDTILKRNSLFVGVGAAHLPGSRGVIELLRKKGYTLRPIKMVDRDAAQKQPIDKMKVPVVFTRSTSDDGFYTVDVPGPLFKMADDNKFINRQQYADMTNGSYYMVTRVKTYASFIGQSEEDVLKKLDSLLYENIPGTILQKKLITKNGYSGYDILNKTRRGDEQRFNIFITPYEVLVFKMSGTESYIEGTEGDHFFSSIQLNRPADIAVTFTPKQGGFSIKLPQTPVETLSTNSADGINRWEYETIDKTNGDAYIIFKKSVYNFKFLEEDSFDVKLIEESFRSPELFDKQVSRTLSSFNGYPCLDVKELMKDSSLITARYIIKGPHYYLIAVRSKDTKKDFSSYFNSFHFTSYQYQNNIAFADTSMHFTVSTPVVPALDESYRSTLEKMADQMNYHYGESEYSYWQKEKNAWFQSDLTGEAVGVRIQAFPKYYYKDDSAKYWSRKEMADYYNKSSMVLYSADSFQLNNGVSGMRLSLRDTGSSRTINRLFFLKDNYIYSLVSLSDTLNQQSDFVNSFYKTFLPEQKKLGRSIFVNCTDSFFIDLFNKDSATHENAKKAIENISFTEKDIPQIIHAINKLNIADKDYYDIKSSLIEALGNINDSTKQVIVDQLKKIYDQTVDTSTFQNEVLTALSKHRTTSATLLFKELILQDPPVFDNSYEYSTFFTNLQDSLKLAATLFPDVLQLAALDDYKQPVTSLLVTLVDSGYVKASQYETGFNKIYFDAKIELKKQQNKEQKKKQDSKKDTDNDDDDISYNNDHNEELDHYVTLLMPFYDKNPNVPKYFEKLFSLMDERLKLNTALLLLKNNKPVPDSILISLAGNDQYRSILYYKLEKMKRLDKFPAKYEDQLDIAKSDLAIDKDYKLDSVVFLSKQPATYKNEKGIVYFFKYRIKKDDDWKIGICGIQPDDSTKINGDEKLTEMTDKKLKEDEPQDEQLAKQLKKILFTAHKSAVNFYDTSDNERFRTTEDSGD